MVILPIALFFIICYTSIEAKEGVIKIVTLDDFKKIRYDCDICPIKNCSGRGFNLLVDCYDDVMQFWKHNKICPNTGYLQILNTLEEFVNEEDIKKIRQEFLKTC